MIWLSNYLLMETLVQITGDLPLTADIPIEGDFPVRASVQVEVRSHSIS
jgi:hypothetical protein